MIRLVTILVEKEQNQKAFQDAGGLGVPTRITGAAQQALHGTNDADGRPVYHDLSPTLCNVQSASVRIIPETLDRGRT